MLSLLIKKVLILRKQLFYINTYKYKERRPMQRSDIVIVSMLLLFIFPAVSLPGSSQGDVYPFWHTEWSD
jgi:hypothetical protein